MVENGGLALELVLTMGGGGPLPWPGLHFSGRRTERLLHLGQLGVGKIATCCFVWQCRGYLGNPSGLVNGYSSIPELLGIVTVTLMAATECARDPQCRATEENGCTHASVVGIWPSIADFLISTLPPAFVSYS